jgi:hypothetical protein
MNVNQPVVTSIYEPLKARTTAVITYGKLWVVTYQGEAVNLKVSMDYAPLGNSKYRIEVFTSETRAKNRAARLNKMFKCDDFTTYEVEF